MKEKYSQMLVIAGLISIAILSRTTFNLGANFELVTATSITLALLIRSRYTFLATLAVMVISDLIIGNSNIFVFTWSGFVLGHLLAKFFRKKGHNVFKATGLAVVSVLVFYIWTNLGVVIMGSMYPHTLRGLAQSYINALPFLRPQLLSAVIYTPVMYLATKQILKFAQKRKNRLSLQPNI